MEKYHFKMSLKISLCTLAIALLFSLATAGDGHIDASQFGYSGTTGPNNWGKVSPTCSNGKKQSPININKKEAVHSKNLKPLTRDYKKTNATLVNNGFNVGVLFEEGSGIMVSDGKNYSLKQMHWHSPSEHRINGEQFPAELHLVHKAQDTESYSVVSILYKDGDADPFISKIEKKLVELAKDKCSANEEAHVPLGTYDNKLVRKSTRKYYRYVGSLTTPPCSESVTWNILGKIRSISKEQVEALKAPLNDSFKQNCRPMQPLNGRIVEIYDENKD